VPSTFGAKVAVWIDELCRHAERLRQLEPRAFVAMLGGGAGTAASFQGHGAALQRRMGELLGLGSMPLPGRTLRLTSAWGLFSAKAIDEEVRRIVEQCYGNASSILTENEDKLHTMAEALVEYETLSPEQIEDIMAGAKPREPSDEPTSGSASSTVDESARREGEESSGPIGGPAEET